MRKGLWMLSLCFLALPIGAQNEKENGEKAKSVVMKEVTVEAARVTKKVDGLLIIPSAAQREASTDGYSLLAKLSLPRLRVDEVMRTVTPLMNDGSVQIRLNGTLASKEDLLSLDPKLVKNIDFIDNPGVRYGEGIGYVIDIQTRRNTTGYVLGADLSNAVTTLNGDNTVYAKVNHKNSELALTFTSLYKDQHGFRSSEVADYTLNNGSHYLVSRNQTDGRSRRFGNQFEIKYSLADSATYVFQADLSVGGGNTPGNYAEFVYRDGTVEQTYRTINVSSDFSPTLDLYFFHQLGKHQSVTANVVGSGIYTDKRGYNGEGRTYAYDVDGRTWSLESEAIYENKLKPFTLSVGLEHSMSFTNNEYTGDVSALNKVRRGELYIFSQVKGRWKQLGYSAGVGVANKTYSQGDHSFDYWTFRPKLTLSYEVLTGLSARYTFETYRRVSSYAMVSDAKIRENSREWKVGNPNLQPSRVIKNIFDISYNGSRVSCGANIEYRRDLGSNMSVYERTPTDEFLYSQQNVGNIMMIANQNYVRYDVVPERLSVTLFGGVFRFFNVSSLYRHYLTSYNYGGNVEAYLGRWTLTGYADNGWKYVEGEHEGRNGAAIYFGVSYRWSRCSLSLFMQHPFQQHPVIQRGKVLNENLYKTYSYRSRDLGNMITLKFSWKLSRGKSYKEIEKKVQNEGYKQTGIM
ncbi:TonB-dependent receptor [Prevotella jejuni]|uniref:hypothetical protein n=1 Tax=Prevotella jejuni TaxID=1177574 RepID=UPI0028DB01F8|nr:hypothetical protein [Prevotella jejuni]